MGGRAGRRPAAYVIYGQAVLTDIDLNALGSRGIGVKTGATWTARDTNFSAPPQLTIQFGLAGDLPLAWRDP